MLRDSELLLLRWIMMMMMTIMGRPRDAVNIYRINHNQPGHFGAAGCGEVVVREIFSHDAADRSIYAIYSIWTITNGCDARTHFVYLFVLMVVTYIQSQSPNAIDIYP